MKSLFSSARSLDLSYARDMLLGATVGEFSTYYSHLLLDMEYGTGKEHRNLLPYALWIDGVCVGVYTRARDAKRAYKQSILSRNIPAWIEDSRTGDLIIRLAGGFRYA